jgi:succinate-semialdehyde dehydrogenase/glutarate-semialdehyde dehydrogenase
MSAPATHLAEVESRNPATSEVVARFPCTPASELPAILARARRVQSAWAAQTLESRCALAARFGEKLFARREECADLLMRETGKPHVEACFAELMTVFETSKYYARHAPAILRDQRVPHQNLAFKAKRALLRYEPCGVIGILSPWNFPVAIPAGQILSAVVTGNAVVFKPSEITPACGALIAQCFAEAGLPPDVLQTVQGAGDVGAALIEARPDKIVFTGSVPTGRRIAEACARRLIPSVLELGGKDAMIVLADADLEAASSAAVWGSFQNCGQACLSVERIYVEQGISQRFIDRCVAKTNSLKLGPASEPDVEVGPMIRPEAVERVETQLREAVSAGARILAGGRRRPDLGPSFLEPTVITGVTPAMRIMQEETFGPVLAVATVRDADEAVSLANDSSFSLAASVWTGDARRGREIAARLKAGAVMINDVASYFVMVEAPHGGQGDSGWGRTHGRVGLLEMVQVKYIDSDLLPRWPKVWWFGYNSDVNRAARSFIEFMYAPGLGQRWRSATGALKALWRSHRI